MANIDIGGRLHSTATGNVVAGANEIYDDTEQKKQSQINAELRDEQSSLSQSLEGKQDEITAVVVPNIVEDEGDPSVTATFQDGQLEFAFKNLKGETGETGATGATGPQGATGIYNPENPSYPLTTLETTLGQDQTKTMTQKGITDSISSEVSPDIVLPYIIGTALTKFNTSSSGYTHGLVKVDEGEKFAIENYSESSDNVRFAFVTSEVATSGSDIPLVANTSAVQLSAQTAVIATAPAGAKFLIYNYGSNYSVKVHRVSGRVNPLGEPGYSEQQTMSQKAVTEALYMKKRLYSTGHVLSAKYINPAQRLWKSGSAIRSSLIPVTPGKVYEIKFTSDILSNTLFGFLSSDVVTLDEAPSVAYGLGLNKPEKDVEYHMKAPGDAVCLYVYERSSSSSVQSYQLYELESIAGSVEENTNAVASLQTDVAQIQQSLENVTAESGMVKSYAGKKSVGSAEWPELISDEKVIIVPVYGQSFAINTDGGYRVTSNFDSNLYKHKSASPTNTIIGAGDTEMRALTQGSSYEQLAAAFVQVLSRLLRQYCHKAQDMIVGAYGKGDTTIYDLSEGSTQYDNVFAVGVQNAANAKLPSENTPRGKSCPFILYLQGEADTTNDASSCNGDKDLYKERFLTLKSQMQTTVKAATGQSYNPVIFINTAGHASWTTQDNGIQQAQVELAEENEDVFLIGSYYYMPTLYLDGASNPHLSPNGKRWLAEKFAQKVFEVMIKGEDNNMLIKEGAVSGKKIVLSLSVPEPPIVFDTWTGNGQKNNYGFMVYSVSGNTRTPLTIDSVIASGTQIIITLNEAPASGTSLMVTYANSDVGGKGNVRDSGAWRSLGTYTSNENTATSTIPKDEDGTSNIIGKRYPMQSWLPQCRIELTV